MRTTLTSPKVLADLNTPWSTHRREGPKRNSKEVVEAAGSVEEVTITNSTLQIGMVTILAYF